MSIPVSIGDCHLLVKGLRKVTSPLRGEAVEEFKQYKTIYHQLTGLSEYLDAFMESNEGAQDTFAKDFKRIRRLLKRFYSKIKALKPHLDRGRPRKSFLGAIVKIKWPRYSQKLQQLHNDLKEQISIITLKKQLKSTARGRIHSGRSPWQTRPRRFCIRLLMGRTRFITNQINTLRTDLFQCLHELLLRAFPENDPGNEAIVHQRYLIHKADSDIDILPSRPAKPFRDTVSKDDRIEISIIFPHEDRYETHCPRCEQERQLQCRIISHVGGLIARGPMPPERRKSRIRDFSRVTLCRVQWPDLSRHNVHRKASKQLRRSISGIRRHAEWLESKDFPPEIASRFLNSRIGNGRINRAKLLFFQFLVQAFQSQEPHIHYSQEAAKILCSYLHGIDEEMVQFQAPNLEFRCLLWICWYVLSTEADILRSHSAQLNRWSIPEGLTRGPTPLIWKLAFLPHAVIFPPLCRFTLDVVLDFKEKLNEAKPLHIPVGIYQMAKRSSSISTQFYLDGYLNNYFLASGGGWPACQDWMEAIMRSKGVKLESASVYYDLRRIMEHGNFESIVLSMVASCQQLA
ncbi:hypothetical protein BGZ61DRAFT_376744 [Ilyonectria robusta]|uniref:uncharacterized protein n=1 Tax=Ilyonectria robusta TaxID=1079257 RepID=UPI001E8EF3C3|nr:uncharacterized protein BGZ61DRAFT_376744 [Ilyonectria robusta]KAH8646530.1 hypothetical protein BGZ61DRAFT_376744 [Ilyonectria robusta]